MAWDMYTVLYNGSDSMVETKEVPKEELSQFIGDIIEQDKTILQVRPTDESA